MKMRTKQIIQVSLLFFWLHFALSQTPPFNFDTGNSPIQVIIPTVLPIFEQDVAKGASDATIVLRTSTLVTNAWFDAIAPYHPTAVGVYTKHKHRLTETTNKNKNIALLYASYHVLCSLFPKRINNWGQMLKGVGLDPQFQSEDFNTPEGLGIIAGKKVAKIRQQDGMNQLGDRATLNSRRTYNRIPFSDYTGYTPKNTAHELKDPSSWQPTLVSTGIGLFKSQEFVTPQMRLTTPYSFKDPQVFKTPKPKNSDVKNVEGYRAQAQLLIEASANLDTDKKLRSEYFDNKFGSLGFSVVSTSMQNNLTLEQFVHLDFLTNVAAFDTAIVVWQEKQRHNSVRPWTAIGYLWKNKQISSWGGPGKGLVSDMPANEWKSYLNTADHPEYPSGSASFCATHTLVARKFLKNDIINLKIPYLKGQSVRQPGVTPEFDTFIEFKTWTDFNAHCGQSRIWGGVHFPDAVSAGRNIGSQVGQLAYDFVMSHINGTAKTNGKK